MAYIPKSKIKKSTTLGGVFLTKKEKTNYKGDYFETSNGLYYAGHNNLDLSQELIKVKNDNKVIKPRSTEKNVVKYNVYKSDIANFLSQTVIPPSNKEKPTEKDYTRGYFTRYFCKKINDQLYIEINKDTFTKLRTKTKDFDSNLYEPGKITWHLTGNVFKLNTIVLQRNSRNFPNISYLFLILNEHQKPTISIQENLYTEGKELYYANGDEYIGEYHIHPTIGPMVGALHTMVEHKKLYYMSQLPKPNGMDYEDWLSSQPVPSTPGIGARKKYISFNNSRYFTEKFSNDYGLGQILYRQHNGLFFQAYENILIQPNNRMYYTELFSTHLATNYLLFDETRKKYYYYPQIGIEATENIAGNLDPISGRGISSSPLPSPQPGGSGY